MRPFSICKIFHLLVYYRKEALTETFTHKNRMKKTSRVLCPSELSLAFAEVFNEMWCLYSMQIAASQISLDHCFPLYIVVRST